MRKYFQIAIDGPVAAGKGTVSQRLAENLKFLYVDTGATYRVATLIAIEEGLNFDSLAEEDEKEVERLVEKLAASKLELSRPGPQEQDDRLITVKLNGQDVSWKIRDESVSHKVPLVAKLAAVREVLVEKQQEIAKANDVVMEGRDITSRVLPEADIRIYLDAQMKERARRRYVQLLATGQDVSMEEVEKKLIERDKLDQEREVDPLKLAEGVWYIDTTGMTIEAVVIMISKRVEKLMGR